MVAHEFYAHAHAISQAVFHAIQVYCARAGIPWDAAAFENESDLDLEQLGRDVLFYGADTFPDPEDR